MPTVSPERASSRLIPLFVLAYFRRPELASCSREPRATAPGMPMPKTAVHEERHTTAWKQEVRTPWQGFHVKPEPETSAVQVGPHHLLGARIFSSDPRHDPATVRGLKYVHSC